MANIKSAKKRIKVIDKKTARNRRVRNHLKAVLKNFENAVAEGNFETAEEKFRLAEKKLMQAASKGTISKNAASPAQRLCLLWANFFIKTGEKHGR